MTPASASSIHVRPGVSRTGWPPASVNVAVNGVVRATTRTFDFEGWPAGKWQVFVAPRHFTKGVNRVKVFVIRDTGVGTVRLDEAFALNATTAANAVN